ncbi:16S rRNA (adenine(1518)-N(6)/adenine(1519)-N(6))-dimethyltransferase RsmA [Porphyromonas sp. COT-239 OH1446]|uniref:16S rRNA (adenine(1518)-N(6)/adenine(1519)-N(6))- dimethyltransferase RsmA n=1 Tax=Porphyromonas sp. COT-239 OH1446 TaxID=1515613 RepID=UPI00052BBDC7|nr:16S rRNA (adenine(1518)-N(6)/adenine(1519)-N(6))-dimethyltransferase RsmA [Porphyromonas sp. COT-239 OH1446]KGN72174.1 16S rRNA methyltransferase [Porphyromonas sp. COT-239 OH1446]
MNQVRAKKALGQHFLTDLSIAERIADTLQTHPNLPVLEIGPGMGVLTQYLLAKGYDTRVIEIDRESVAYLQRHYPQLEGRIISGDFLEMSVDEMMPEGEFALIGNYPYNISSQIFFKLLEHRDRIPVCSGMLQREVAMRLASPPGNKDYGILSVLLQAWYDVEYLFTVDEHVFNPPPKVKSGVIKLVRNGRVDLGCSEQHFKRIIKAAFNQRRKTLRNSLRGVFGSDYDGYGQDIFSLRPEQLSVEQFISLTQMEAKAHAR